MHRFVVPLRWSIMLILLLVSAGFPPCVHGAETASNHSISQAVGTLKVWIPAGMVGDDYWIYLDGHIVSAPPRGWQSTRGNFVIVPLGKIHGRGDGWEIWTAKGLILRMRHENYDNLISYIDSASLDPWHVFEAFALPLQPGSYRIEVVFLSPGSSTLPRDSVTSFPFVISRKYVVDVRKGETTRLYPGVPDDWDENPVLEAMPARRLCPEGPSPPDDVQLQSWLDKYMDDPMVKTLRGADVSSNGVVVLDLPAALGGVRELDGSQIRHIADAISTRSNVPRHREVAECRSLFPQFSKAYAQYDKIISVIDGDIERFRKLAATSSRLARGH